MQRASLRFALLHKDIDSMHIHCGLSCLWTWKQGVLKCIANNISSYAYKKGRVEISPQGLWSLLHLNNMTKKKASRLGFWVYKLHFLPVQPKLPIDWLDHQFSFLLKGQYVDQIVQVCSMHEDNISSRDEIMCKLSKQQFASIYGSWLAIGRKGRFIGGGS